MPIYEYECATCGRFEVIQKPSERALTLCPQCKEKGKKSKIARLVSPAAFHLKGGGWYKTDYTSSKGSSADKAAPSTSDSANSAASPSTGSAVKDTSKSGESAGNGEAKKAAGGGCGGACTCH